VMLRPKRQATFPKAPCDEAGLVAGDRLWAHADGPGRIVFEKIPTKALDDAPAEDPPV
jgi:hypothetical protein